jgi:hypothetical protein
MKAKILLIILIFLGLTALFISMKSSQINAGPHGGRIQQADNFNIEAKVSDPYFYAYLLTKENQSIENKGMSCEISFFFADSTNLDFPLKPHSKDGFRLESTISDYLSYRITFHAFGRNISAKFENENAIVRKRN